jgi:hypothetical protein
MLLLLANDRKVKVSISLNEGVTKTYYWVYSSHKLRDCWRWSPLLSTQVSAPTSVVHSAALPVRFTFLCCALYTIPQYWVYPHTEIQRIEVRWTGWPLYRTIAAYPMITKCICEIICYSFDKIFSRPIVHKPHLALPANGKSSKTVSNSLNHKAQIHRACKPLW